MHYSRAAEASDFSALVFILGPEWHGQGWQPGPVHQLHPTGLLKQDQQLLHGTCGVGAQAEAAVHLIHARVENLAMANNCGDYYRVRGAGGIPQQVDACPSTRTAP